MRKHTFKKVECSGKIVVIVFQRKRTRLAHSLKTSKVNNRLNIVVRCKNSLESLFVKKVALDKFGTLSTDFFYSVKNTKFAVAKIVYDDNFFTGVKKFNNGVVSQQ